MGIYTTIGVSISLILCIIGLYTFYPTASSIPRSFTKARTRVYTKRTKTGKKIKHRAKSNPAHMAPTTGDLSSNWKRLQATLKGSSKDAKINKRTSSNTKAKKVSTKSINAQSGTVRTDRVEHITVADKVDANSVTRLTSDSKPDLQVYLGADDTSLVRTGDGKAQLVLSSSSSTSKRQEAGNYVAIDCEFVGVGIEGRQSALARVSIVNYYGHVLLDTFVKPKERVSDWRTWVSGVSPQDMKHAIRLEECQKKVAEIFKGRVVVGHAIHNDLKALMISHPKSDIRDTSLHRPFRKLAKGGPPSLKMLSDKVLNLTIQTGEHSSVEDAQATMLLFRLNKKQFDLALRHKKSHKK